MYDSPERGRPNKPATGNLANDASSLIAIYEVEGKLSDRDALVLVDATRQLITAHTAAIRAMSRIEAVSPAIRGGLNEIHAVTTGRVSCREHNRGRH